MIFADKIIEERKKLGLSQEELAERLGVSRQAVSKWEGAQSTPDLVRILELSKLFGVSIDYLLKEDLEQAEYVNQPDDTDSPIRRISMAEANDFLVIKEKTAPTLAIGVALCILSPTALFLLSAASEYGLLGIDIEFATGIGICVLLAVIAGAVAIFLRCNAQTTPYNFLERVVFETEYGVTEMVIKKQTQYIHTYTRKLILGVSACIVSAVPLIVCASITDNEFLHSTMLCVLLAIVAFGVFHIIVANIRFGSFQQLLQEGDYSKKKKAISTTAEAISDIYWPIVVAIYLGYSFFTQNWSSSWIIWPVSALIFAAISSICKLTDKHTTQ